MNVLQLVVVIWLLIIAALWIIEVGSNLIADRREQKRRGRYRYDEEYRKTQWLLFISHLCVDTAEVFHRSTHHHGHHRKTRAWTR